MFYQKLLNVFLKLHIIASDCWLRRTLAPHASAGEQSRPRERGNLQITRRLLRQAGFRYERNASRTLPTRPPALLATTFRTQSTRDCPNWTVSLYF